MEPNHFILGNWKVEPKLNRISPVRGGKHTQLEPQLMKLLLCLKDNQGELVTKDALLNVVWNGVIVGENVLTRAISSLRKALGDHPQNPTYIETISKTGYRLIAKVELPDKDGKQKLLDGRYNRSYVIAISIVFVLLFAAFSKWGVLAPAEKIKVLHPVAIANNDFTEYYPAISHDGQFAAFSSRPNDSRNWEIYVKRIGTEVLVPLTDNPAVDMKPVWSSDDAYVYYMRYEDGTSNIFKVPMTGGNESRVLTPGKYCHGNFDVSPKNDQIAYNNRSDRGKPLQIELTNLEFGEKRTISNPPEGYNGDIHPTYSPDGTKLGFIREKNPVSMYLYVVDIETGEETQITTEHVSINGFDWSTDGKSLVYGTDKTGIYKLWKVNLEDQVSTLLPVADYQMVMPRIADNGQMIYAKLQDNVNIWSFSALTKEAKSWRATNELDLNPSFSPSGSRVAFTTNHSDSFQLWSSDVAGDDAFVVTDFKGQFLNIPRWSPDGKTLVFQGYHEGQSNIYTVNSQGGIPENLTKSESENHTPMFSDDGQYIYYSSNSSGNWELWKMTISGGQQEQITTDGGYAPQLNPKDDSKIFFVKKDQIGLWRFNQKDGTESLEIELFDPKKYGAFSVSEKGIYFFNPANRTIDFKDFSTDEITTLIQPKKISPLGISLSYSEENKLLLYAQVDHIDADIMLLESK
ncbi:MAG: winged helix-turn-helix domain-containing protein [Bacteroidota bacterium]